MERRIQVHEVTGSREWNKGRPLFVGALLEGRRILDTCESDFMDEIQAWAKAYGLAAEVIP